MTNQPVLKHFDDLETFRISPQDSVKLTPLTGPEDGSPTSVFFEIWEPGGAQPDNSHADSVEIFIILAGVGRATSDEKVVDLVAGDVLVLPVGSVHHIENVSQTEKLYAVTIMANDPGALAGGFEKLVRDGTVTQLSESDRRSLLGR